VHELLLCGVDVVSFVLDKDDLDKGEWQFERIQGYPSRQGTVNTK
jgi:hypothetical protein